MRPSCTDEEGAGENGSALSFSLGKNYVSVCIENKDDYNQGKVYFFTGFQYKLQSGKKFQ